MNWLTTSLNWYFYLFILGLAFLPFTKKIFKNFSFDFGFPFSKTLAILFLSYLSYVLGIFKLLKFTKENLLILLFLFSLINIFLIFREKNFSFKKNQIFVFIFEEILFLSSFLFWSFVRSQEPSIQSLEKFMDFGFINSILRSDYFPPKDIWYTPLPINYYYFGHLTGAFLIKLTNIIPTVGYNLILATLFAQGVTQTFSFVANLIIYSKILDKTSQLILIKNVNLFVVSLLGAYLVNLGGNLHTIYLFTKGYPNDNPIPFWQIFSKYNPLSYWYPNATRFIPYTIHEFPSYSYVVADLHGHVFDIPFVLLTLAILFLTFTKLVSTDSNRFQPIPTIFLGFLTAIHYMTNAFDGPIYLLLSFLVFFIIYQFSFQFFYSVLTLVFSFIFFSYPFSSHFSPFVSGIGVNCSPKFLTDIGKIGPFLFEAGNCQISPFWMLFVLWGFFWINFLVFLLLKNHLKNKNAQILNQFVLILFSFGTFLILIPEFFYIKDIYPAHFRANTMFKLGYQAFIMMSITSAYTFLILKNQSKLFFKLLYLVPLILVLIYPFYSIPSYYGKLDRTSNLDGLAWINNFYPEDREIIEYLNKNIKGQPVILEAQGDSYTNYERISANTGLPTVAGWWVHEWLWRGSADVVGKRIPDIQTIYELNLYDDYQKYYKVLPNDYLIKIAEKIKFDNWKMIYELNKDKIKDPNLIFPNQELVVLKEKKINKNKVNDLKKLLEKYQIKYIIVSTLEKEKYPNLKEDKFEVIGKKIFETTNLTGAIYQVN